MKYDGYRCQAAIRGSEVRLYSRNGHDWTKQFSYVASALAKLTKGSLLIDGEICAINAEGRSDLTLLKSSLDGHTTYQGKMRLCHVLPVHLMDRQVTASAACG